MMEMNEMGHVRELVHSIFYCMYIPLIHMYVHTGSESGCKEADQCSNHLQRDDLRLRNPSMSWGDASPPCRVSPPNQLVTSSNQQP